MVDLPGGRGKVPITPRTAVALGDGRWELTDYNGRVFVLTDDPRPA